MYENRGGWVRIREMVGRIRKDQVGGRKPPLWTMMPLYWVVPRTELRSGPFYLPNRCSGQFTSSWALKAPFMWNVSKITQRTGFSYQMLTNLTSAKLCKYCHVLPNDTLDMIENIYDSGSMRLQWSWKNSQHLVMSYPSLCGSTTHMHVLW